MSDELKERLLYEPSIRGKPKKVVGWPGWTRPDNYYCETKTHTVCKVSIDGNWHYEAWRKGGRLTQAKRLGIFDTSDEAFSCANRDAKQ
jgi:hypothetical protein